MSQPSAAQGLAPRQQPDTDYVALARQDGAKFVQGDDQLQRWSWVHKDNGPTVAEWDILEECARDYCETYGLLD